MFSIGVELTKVTKGQLNLDKNYQLVCDDFNFIPQLQHALSAQIEAIGE